jgi:hypothetical protein
MDIPRIADRLRCMIYRRRLELDVEEIRPDLDILHGASQELKTSQRFRHVLQVRNVTYARLLFTLARLFLQWGMLLTAPASAVGPLASNSKLF